MSTVASQTDIADDSLADYWRQSRRPLTSLVFVLPLLVVYEAGVLALGPEAVRNGAEVWMRHVLGAIGFGQYLLLPLLTCGLLLAWHHVVREPWQVRGAVLGGMALETVCFTILLLGIARLQSMAFAHVPLAMPLAAAGDSSHEASARFVSFLGAGIYEELLFHLMLLPAVIFAFRSLGWKPFVAAGAAVAATSLLFSLVHYACITGVGDAWNTYSFVFRFLAGALFGGLFLWRGFGIAAGTHALYDVLVGMLLR